MNNTLNQIQDLIKAIEAGGYNAAPSTLVQGSALQREDLSPVLENVTYSDRHILLQKYLRVDSAKTTLVQFDRQLSYGQGFGFSSQLEGNVGQENTSDYVRIVVPMVYFSEVRRVTIASTLVDTVDGKKADERAAADAALLIAGNVELALFRGKADFSNAGVFDGNPLVIPQGLPDMVGLDLQVRQSDNERNAQDLMFSEYGSNQSVVIPGGTHLTQENIEDAATRSRMNMGNADHLFVDPIVQSNYNKLYLGGAGAAVSSGFNNQRAWLGEKPTASGADLRTQWVSNGQVALEASRFLSGKTTGSVLRSNSPLPPVSVTPADGVAAGTTFVAGDTYWYAASSANEAGESALMLAPALFTVATSGHSTLVTIVPPAAGLVRYYNVYRSPANGPQSSMKFIGRVLAAGTTIFTDLNNKVPGFVTGFLVQDDTMSIAELSPFSRIKLAVTDLSMPEAFYRFCSICVKQPRKNVLIDNLS